HLEESDALFAGRGQQQLQTIPVEFHRTWQISDAEGDHADAGFHRSPAASIEMRHHSPSPQPLAKASAVAFTLGRISTCARDDGGMADAPQRAPAIAPTRTGL